LGRRVTSRRPGKDQLRRVEPGSPPADLQEGAVATTPESGKIAEAIGPIAGIAPAQATRSGEDARRRGWFWHWNSIVTQYAPLIGLKGVGLINSYTVWTDRREESPHRGYAFPSQQREADFYGEDRAELITINKILVALDLIEIRKEMVLRADDQGRRWRVPHNFYRVKDHHDGFHLTSEHVLRVIDLADRDKTVYRYIRRIFSDRFAPIDSDNVWARILPEIRQTEVWQRLASRAAHEEDRASARTRAGHAARKASLSVPADGDSATPTIDQNDSGDDASPMAKSTSVATINKGLDTDVEPGNIGSTRKSTTSVAPANKAVPTGVDRSNTTYDQDELVTTTTTTPVSDRIEIASSKTIDTAITDEATNTTVGTKPLASRGPDGHPAPEDAAGEAAALQAFEDANGKRSTPAQRKLLADLAEQFEPAARRSNQPDMASGWAWLTAAVYEAVEAGSAFVAPRRLREIMSRWDREGLPGDQIPRRERREPVAKKDGKDAVEQPAVRLGGGPDLALPHGFGSQRTWEFTISLLSTVIDRERLAELFAGSAIAGYAAGEVTLSVENHAQADRIMGEYRDLVTRKLSEAMRRPVRLAVLLPAPADAPRDESPVQPVTAPVDDRRAEEEITIPSFLVAECGLPSGQVWAGVLDEIAHAGSVTKANLDTWLRQTNLIGRGDDGALIVGVPHPLAQQRITRLLPALRTAVRTVVGPSVDVEIVVTREWLQENQLHVPTVGEEGEAAAGD
jgi:hypothetical protein